MMQLKPFGAIPIAVSLLVLPLCAQAEPITLTGVQINEVLSDQSLYGDDVEQIFQKSGQTVYIDHGNPSQGTWFVEGNQYCSRWPPSNTAACYDVTQDGNVITFVSRSGKNYPMRRKK